eukprot:g352.t1
MCTRIRANLTSTNIICFLVSVEELYPVKSWSESVHTREENNFEKLVTSIQQSRHLSQTASSFVNRVDDSSCELTSSQRRRFYDRSTGVWSLTGEALEELNDDIQSIISCTNPDDTVLLPTSRTIQPPRSIVIDKNLTLSSQSERPLLRNGVISEMRRKTRLTCPQTGDLLILRSSSITVANIVFLDCNGSGNVISLDTGCDDNSSTGTIHFVHLEFRNHKFSDDKRLLDSIHNGCTRIFMNNVIIRNNQCGTSGCMFLVMNNTIRNIQITRNRRETDSDSMVVPALFILPQESETVATNISASQNQIRIFSVFSSIFNLRESYFDGNRVNAMNSDAQESVGGSVLISNNSVINIMESVFVNNFGQNGGSVYAISSEYNVSNCIFRENDAGVGSGGAIYAVNQSSFIFTSCTFSKNNADRGAGVFTSHTSSLQFLDTRFWENTANNGAGLFIVDGNMSMESCEFCQNNCSFGGAMVTNFVTGTILDTVFYNNNASWGGACAFMINSTMSIEGTEFIQNHAETSASAIYVSRSILKVQNSVFGNNEVSPSRIETDIDAVLRQVAIFTDSNYNNLNGHGTVFIESSSTNFIGVQFENNTADLYGGGVYAYSSNVTINQSLFINNSAWWRGGAIYGTDRSRLQIVDTQILNNTVTRGDLDDGGGGGAYLDRVITTMQNANFSWNEAANAWGGGLYIINGTFSGYSSTFLQNRAESNGGGIYAQHMLLLSLSGSVFRNNSGSHGGAISAYNSTAIFTRSCIFIGNNGTTSGGGIYQSQSLSAVLLCHFEANVAQYGGSLWIGSVSQSSISNCTFISNKASSNGGGIQIYFNTRVLISNSSFSRCQSVSGGGAVNLHTNSNLTVSSCSFARNQADCGAGVRVYHSKLKVEDADFKLSRTTSSGAGICSQTGTIDIERSTFESNSVLDGSGGGLYLRNGTFNGHSLTFLQNQATHWCGGICAEDVLLVNLSEVLFMNNSGNYGGAIGIYNTTLNLSQSCVFIDNKGLTEGGGIHQSLSNSSIMSCNFENNTAQFGGSISIRDMSQLNITNCTFSNSTARFRGGGIQIYNNARISLINSSFSSKNNILICARCQSFLDGGAINIRNESNLVISSCSFSRNQAPVGAGVRNLDSSLIIQNSEFKQGLSSLSGGGIHSTNGTVNIYRSVFERNRATFLGGALYLDKSVLRIRSTKIRYNQGTNYGGIYATNQSHVNATRVSFDSNMVAESGGGAGVGNGSSLFCRRCVFSNNVARWGAGLLIQSNDSILVAAQLQDSTILNNTAFSLGGGLLFIRPPNITRQCNEPNMTCGRVVLLRTRFANNSAGFSGAAILTSDPEGVLFTCNNTDTQTEFMNRQDLNSLDLVHPKRLCRSWRRNRVRNNAHGGVIGNYGRYLSFSTASNDEVQIVGDVDSGFVFLNAVSGRQLPTVNITVVDSYGNGPIPTIPDTLEAIIFSPDEFFQGSIPIDITGGSGNFSSIVGFKKPGNYSIKIIPDIVTINVAELTVIVRACFIGEEPTTDDVLCQPCDSYSYNFNPTKVGGCSPCPIEATCENRFIVPKEGYWHKSPCQINVKECLTEEACSYKERQKNLTDFSTDYFDCKFNQSMLELYGKELCREGYQGPLCGSCTASYGLSIGSKCSKCSHEIESVLLLIFFTLYLLAISSFTVRGGLPLKPKTPVSAVSTVSTLRFEQVRQQPQDVDINLQMVEWMAQGRVPSAYFRAREAPPSSSSALSSSNKIPPTQSSELELTRWITSEIFKVMINFLQVTAVAASIDLNWSEEMLTMFESSEYLGGLTTAALSRPIDCIFSSQSAVVRSIWRTLLSLLVPGTVMGILAVVWGVIAFRERKGMLYFWKRFILSVVAIAYISYLGLTKLAVRVFYCVDVYDSSDPFSDSQTKYWAVDTAIKCFDKEHSGLIIIAVFILVLVSLLFPLLSAIMLSVNADQDCQRSSWIHETMGFLYRAFKEKFVFWESVVMLRKACLSIIVVFSYPLGGHLQGQLALGVLLFCLYFQLICDPYRQEFHSLNYYESGSLLVSCFTFLLGQIVNDESCSDSTKTFLEVVTIMINIAFFTLLMFTFLKSGMNHIKEVLKFEDVAIDDNANSWVLLKVFIRHRMSRVSCLKT